MAIFPVDRFKKLVPGKHREEIALLAAVQAGLKACNLEYR